VIDHAFFASDNNSYQSGDGYIVSDTGSTCSSILTDCAAYDSIALTNSTWGLFGGTKPLNILFDDGTPVANPVIVMRDNIGVYTSGTGPALPLADWYVCTPSLTGYHILVSNNSGTPAWGSTVNGTGSTQVLGYCDGSNWTVAAQ
jgi:hypothetical protein